MAELVLNREFPAAPDKVFGFITRSENLLRGWGPEGMHITQHRLSFERPGPWMSVMTNPDGQNYKVSGQVTHVDPPHSVGFTWAWHDENDRRGVESHVTIRLSPAQNGGTAFELRHVDLPDDEAAKNHETGWTSSLRKLEKMAG